MTTHRRLRRTITAVACTAGLLTSADGQIAVRGQTVYTMDGKPISDGVVLVKKGKIDRVGPASRVRIPGDYKVLTAAVVTPGLVDAHSVVGLAGHLNVSLGRGHDQDQIERSAAMQPELRAIDAYNPREKLIEWVRSFGVTTVHTGHGPGALISGQTMIAKTYGETVEDAVVNPAVMVAATLGTGALVEGNKPPGTRPKTIAMLRGMFLKAQIYKQKLERAEKDKKPARDLRMETLAAVLDGKLRLLVTVERAHDILSTIRLAKEFDLPLVLDSVSEAHLVLDEIKAAKVPVFLHPPMARARREREHLSFLTPMKFKEAGIPFALQSNFESYVPKTRVVLFEAAIAAANGLSFEDALASITIDAAKILGIDDRVGSLERGKDADIALYDGDPFEYTSHCIGVIINGDVVSEVVR